MAMWVPRRDATTVGAAPRRYHPPEERHPDVEIASGFFAPDQGRTEKVTPDDLRQNESEDQKEKGRGERFHQSVGEPRR